MSVRPTSIVWMSIPGFVGYYRTSYRYMSHHVMFEFVLENIVNIVFASAVAPMFGVCLCIVGTAASADDVMPSDLLEKVSANEALYRDLAVSVRLMRKPGEDAKPPDKIESNNGLFFSR